MSIEEVVFIGMIVDNFIISLIYLIWGILIQPFIRRKNKNKGRSKYIINFFVMILCPVIGILFFAIGYLLFRFIFHKEVDLSDVIFSKERMKSTVKEDVESKLNIVSLEDAIAVSDKQSLRNLMLNIIKGDVHNSLTVISLALNSEDSETSHYAASVLRDELNDFRENVQKMFLQIQKEDIEQIKYCLILLKYMNGVLSQKVFIQLEQEQFAEQMAEIGDLIYHKDRKSMTIMLFEWICIRLLEVRKFELAQEWCLRSMETFPRELSSYTCRLKLYFTMNENEKFFQTMNELKGSNIVIDSQTLELIRTFQ